MGAGHGACSTASDDHPGRGGSASRQHGTRPRGRLGARGLGRAGVARTPGVHRGSRARSTRTATSTSGCRRPGSQQSTATQREAKAGRAAPTSEPLKASLGAPGCRRGRGLTGTPAPGGRGRRLAHRAARPRPATSPWVTCAPTPTCSGCRRPTWPACDCPATTSTSTGTHHLTCRADGRRRAAVRQRPEGQRHQGRPARSTSPARRCRACAPRPRCARPGERRGRDPASAEQGRRRDAAWRRPQGDTGKPVLFQHRRRHPPRHPDGHHVRGQAVAGRHRRRDRSHAVPRRPSVDARRRASAAGCAGQGQRAPRDRPRLRQLPGRRRRAAGRSTRQPQPRPAGSPKGSVVLCGNNVAHLQRRQRQQRGRRRARRSARAGATGYRVPVARERPGRRAVRRRTSAPGTRHGPYSWQTNRAARPRRTSTSSARATTTCGGADRLHRGGRQLRAGQRQRAGPGRRPGARRRWTAPTPPAACPTATTSTTPTWHAARRHPADDADVPVPRARAPTPTQDPFIADQRRATRPTSSTTSTPTACPTGWSSTPTATRRWTASRPARWARRGATGTRWTTWSTRASIKDTAKPGELRVGDVRRRRRGPDPHRGHWTARSASHGRGVPRHPGAGPGGYTYGDFGRVIGARPRCTPTARSGRETLWDLRSALGRKLTESLVTRAMELSPAVAISRTPRTGRPAVRWVRRSRWPRDRSR